MVSQLQIKRAWERVLSVLLTYEWQICGKFLAAIFVIGAFSCEVAYAADSFTNNLNFLKSHGVKQLAGKPVDQLIKEGSSLQIEVDSNVQYVGKDGSVRRSGEWDASSNTIRLSRAHLAKLSESHIEGLVTHEKCQRLTNGACDQNFRNSALIEALKSREAIELRNPRVVGKSIHPSQFKRNFEKGGVTGVDGGGDARILDYFKTVYLQMFYLLSHEQMTFEEFDQIYDLLGLYNFEIDPNVPQGQFRVGQEQQTIYIPIDAMVGSSFDLNIARIEILVDGLVNLIRRPHR